MRTVRISNGRVIDPAQDIDRVADRWVRGDRVLGPQPGAVALAANFWGYCAVIGIGFLGLTFVMAVDFRWAPLEFGASWAVVLVWLGWRLRRLGQQHPG